MIDPLDWTLFLNTLESYLDICEPWENQGPRGETWKSDEKENCEKLLKSFLPKLYDSSVVTWQHYSAEESKQPTNCPGALILVVRVNGDGSASIGYVSARDWDEKKEPSVTMMAQGAEWAQVVETIDRMRGGKH